MDLRQFVDEELYPAIWSNISTLFPEMGFKFSLGKWRSPRNLDGSTPTTPRRDKVVVTQRLFHVALENGGGDTRGRARDLITLYMEHNTISDRIEAIKQMASVCGLTIPEGADTRRYEEARERREQLALSYSRQREALFSQEGAEVLRYLKEERGYSEELIKEMGLGYISPAEAKTLEERCKVGIAWRVEDYPLSIAYFSRGNVMGFKFRYIKTIEGKPKYMNTRSLGTEGMDSNPFGLTPQSLNLGDKKGDVVVVEGELDALHAIALGLPNVIAVAGGKVTEGKARALKKYGYRNVIILLDTDIAGQKFTAESIQTIDKVGLTSAVVSLPGAKDTDEYLRSHTIDELKEEISKAQFGGVFLYLKAREKYEQSQKTDIGFLNFQEEYVRLASSYTDITKREILFTYLRKDFEGLDIENILERIREKVELQAAEKEKKHKREEAANTLRQASDLLANGKAKDAKKTTQKALEALNESERDTEYSFLLEDNTEELWKQYEENQIGLPANFNLRQNIGGAIETIDFFFPSGAISIIGAATGHGKSAVLQSIALDSLKELKEGETLLYITYEENELNVNMQFLNAFANIEITTPGRRGNNRRTIMEYLSLKGEAKTKHIKKEFLPIFQKKEQEWKEIRRTRKIKIVKPEDNYLETLLGLMEYATEHLNIKAIFIDYVQEIYVRDWGKYSRTDELKEAMVRIDLAAQNTKIPIIMGAQLNKEANSPLSLVNQTIADSGWIGRKASEIILLWSNKEKVGKDEERAMANDKWKDVEKELGDELNIGKGGKLYLKLTKSRKFTSGAHTIVPIDGNTGRVGGQKKKEEPQQKKFFVVDSPAPGDEERRTIKDNNAYINTETQRPYRKDEDDEAPF